MHIAFVASECVPFSKTGGLADVVGALPRALAAAGHEISVYLPRYRLTRIPEERTVVQSITVPFDDRYRFCSIVTGAGYPGVRFYFVDYPPFFDRDGLYGTAAGDFPDNAERFALFCRAVLEGSKILGVPDIFHCHDWQSALVPLLLRTQYAEDPAFHNSLPLLMLPWDLFTITKMEYFGNVNFLKGALAYSDMITTVSRKYSQEIQTSEFGFGLEGVLKERAQTVAGILNGVDYDEWNPETDKFIAAHYSAEDLSGKQECKRDLLASAGLNADANSPVIEIVDRLSLEDVLFVALGSGDKLYEEMFLRLARRVPGKVSVRVAYDNALAHKIEAGADMFLMPSHYEPCGLSQIYSLKYGTVPIVRATGGLDDTIDPWDPRTKKGTGFKFQEYTGEALLRTIHQALHLYRDPLSWQKLMRNGMAKDFSWRVSAREYVRVYERVRQLHSQPILV